MKMMSLDEVKAKMQLMGCMIFGCAVDQESMGVRIATCIRLKDRIVFDLKYDPSHPEAVGGGGYYISQPPDHITKMVLEVVSQAEAAGAVIGEDLGMTEMKMDECPCEKCKAHRDAESAASTPAVQAAIDGILSLK